MDTWVRNIASGAQIYWHLPRLKIGAWMPTWDQGRVALGHSLAQED